ncbi:uncharacterized protein LOC108052972 [Drosophila rhopaloa]|uniref:Uncharacterized protein n=1 Tax=Drosophila rhopaloa TaxID=1041015 RepID=A0ABM5I6S4_DRORH|nr:uncharacterized protein LOC108052972 [Drosophila rhopaloa]
MLVLHHNESRNCALHGFHQTKIPTLRFDQLAIVEVRKHFNHNAVSLVCICNDSDTSLLETLAEDTDSMRQERIVLWIQANVTQQLLNEISNQSEKHDFLYVIILEVKDQSEQAVTVRRLEPFPSPRFRRMGNIFGLEMPHFRNKINFKGKTANLLPSSDPGHRVYARLTPEVKVPIGRVQDLVLLEFVRRFNISTKVVTDDFSGIVDFRLNLVSYDQMPIKNLNPYDISSIMVVVPCGKDRSVEEVIKQLDVKSWLLHIVFVYGIFVLAETFILVVTYKISGEAYRLTSLNPLLNLRAFRALLGMSFPISRRSSLSLRQLFLSISIFGMIFSNFFSCKLSALLTTHSEYPHIRNFDDLRASGLTVIVDIHQRLLIESQLGTDFLNTNLTRVKYVRHEERATLQLSLNNTYAYVLLSEEWPILKNYQKLFGKSVFCIPKDLTIIRSLPRTYIEHKNSVFFWPLFKFSIQIQETGIFGHWTRSAPNHLRNDLNVSVVRKPNQKFVPLCLNHLKWLWTVLGCGYGLAMVVFIIEICMEGLHRRPRNQVIVE